MLDASVQHTLLGSMHEMGNKGLCVSEACSKTRRAVPNGPPHER